MPARVNSRHPSIFRAPGFLFLLQGVTLYPLCTKYYSNNFFASNSSFKKRFTWLVETIQAHQASSISIVPENFPHGSSFDEAPSIPIFFSTLSSPPGTVSIPIAFSSIISNVPGLFP